MFVWYGGGFFCDDLSVFVVCFLCLLFFVFYFGIFGGVVLI